MATNKAIFYGEDIGFIQAEADSRVIKWRGLETNLRYDWEHPTFVEGSEWMEITVDDVLEAFDDIDFDIDVTRDDLRTDGFDWDVINDWELFEIIAVIGIGDTYCTKQFWTVIY